MAKQPKKATKKKLPTKAQIAKAKKARFAVKKAVKLAPWELSYKESYAMVVYELALLGFGYEKLAKVFCVPQSHVKHWEKNYDNFRAALATGKELADGKVAKALFNRAIGYSHEETKVHFDKFGDISEHTVLKHYPPDTTAALTWLKIRQKDVWDVADKVEHLGNVAIIAKDEEDL